MNPELLNTESPSGPPAPSGQGPSRVAGYLIAGGVLAGAVALGSLIGPIGLADAQSDDTASEAGSDDATTDDATTDDTTADDASDDGWRGHRGFDGLSAFGIHRAADDLAEALGMEPEELLSALRDGSSLNDLAEANGVDPATLKQQLLDDLGTRLDEAVADGRIDQDRADAIRAEAESHVDELFDLSLDDLPERFGPDGGRRGFGLGLGAGMGLDDLAGSLGLTAEDITTGFADGKSLAEIASDAGIDTQELIDSILATAGEHLDQAVADGRLDADTAAEIEDGLAERVPELVETAPGDLMGRGLGGMMPGGMTGGRDGMPGLGGHRGHHGWFDDDDATTDDGAGADGETEESSLTF